MSNETPELLLVEDDRVAVMGFERALARLQLANRLRVASDGIEALELLRTTGPSAVEQPCLVVLDLNLPRLSGLEMLAELRRDAALSELPVIVLTTSDDDVDRSAALALGAFDYLVKTDMVAELRTIVERLGYNQHEGRRWLRLPAGHG